MFSTRYQNARTDRGDARFERVGSVVDQLLHHELDPQTANVAINGLRWLASKDNDQYGDKVAFDVKHNLGALTDREMAERLLEAVPFLAIACDDLHSNEHEDEQDQSLSDDIASPL